MSKQYKNKIGAKLRIYVNKKADLSTESINILGILELGSIFWMNLVSLEYFLTNKTQKMDLNSLQVVYSNSAGIKYIGPAEFE